MKREITVIRFRRRTLLRRLYDRWGIAPVYVGAVTALALLHALLRLL